MYVRVMGQQIFLVQINIIAVNIVEQDPSRNRRHNLMNSGYQMFNPFLYSSIHSRFSLIMSGMRKKFEHLVMQSLHPVDLETKRVKPMKRENYC
jgi:hypothetical protein